MTLLPTTNPFQEIPCIVQNEEQWIRELKSRFSSLEQLAFQCDCGHIQTTQDVFHKKLPMYKVFLECMKCGMESHALPKGGRLIVRKNGLMFTVFDFVDGENWEME